MYPMVLWLTFTSLLLSAAGSLPAATGTEVRGVTVAQEHLKVFEEKCLPCHDSKRIETAAKSRRNLEEVINKMSKKGLTLSDRERQVIGHFWSRDPLKKTP